MSEEKIVWSEIDKTRFFGIGTGMYSALTFLLHPMSVLKTRQQVGTSSNIIQGNWFQRNYRGVGIVIGTAIPARVVYISTLETIREGSPRKRREEGNEELLPWIRGGMAGGIASMCSQLFIVPMDVISQKQMIASDNPSAIHVGRQIIREKGLLGGLYRGFSLSLMTSIPGGSIWWGTYTACQESTFSSTAPWWQTQIVSGTSAAIMVALCTQPLDVLKTHIQTSSSAQTNIYTLIKQLPLTAFYRGTLPRIFHISVWGTIMSSAFELLKTISRKDQPFPSFIHTTQNNTQSTPPNITTALQYKLTQQTNTNKVTKQ